MFFKLALGNVKKSMRDYAVYFVTLALGVAVFYAFNTISGQASFLSADKRATIQAISGIMTGTTVFLAFVLGFLMVYANNYLVKRRKRELGLYQVLGMTRGQVSRVLVLETLVASVLAFAAGIALGVLFSQLLVFVTASFLHDHVQNFAFRFSPEALELTLACFGLMFLVMLVFNLRTLRKVRLVDLMGAERKNESLRLRSMPVSVAMFVAGLGLVVIAYVRLSKDGLPVTGPSAMPGFGITTLMVIVGTFLLFFSLGGFMLRVAQRFHGAYYHGLNMFTARQLAAKVNTASLSMALISIILFLAITSVTSGLSICSVLNQNAETSAPYDASLSVYYSARSRGDAAGDAVATHPVDVVAQLRDQGYDLSSVAGSLFQATVYSSSDIPGSSSVLLGDFVSSSGGDSLPAAFQTSDASSVGLSVMSESSYNSVRRFLGMDPVSLGADGYLVTTDQTELTRIYDDALANGKTVIVNGRTLRPTQPTCVADASAKSENSSIPASNSGTIVVPDVLVEGLAPYSTHVGMSYSTDTSTGDALIARLGDNERNVDFTEDGASVGFLIPPTARTSAISDSFSTTGVISYLAIYIGFVLVISCAAIIAIQQLSGASDSAPSYRLLSEIGCPRGLSNRSLFAQTLVYFLAPLVVAVCHSVCALVSVISVVKLFGALDISGVALTTAAMFLVVYGAYFLVTYSVAKGVVNARTVEARS